MREIKFRAWSILDKYFCSQSWLVGNWYFVLHDKNTILQQYTGLKDKNGIEIYEGDIVFIVKDKFGEGKDEIWTIEYDTNTASFVTFNQLNSIRSIYESYRGVGFNIVDDFSIIEVIGNIYENPELLP